MSISRAILETIAKTSQTIDRIRNPRIYETAALYEARLRDAIDGKNEVLGFHIDIENKRLESNRMMIEMLQQMMEQVLPTLLKAKMPKMAGMPGMPGGWGNDTGEEDWGSPIGAGGNDHFDFGALVEMVESHMDVLDKTSFDIRAPTINVPMAWFLKQLRDNPEFLRHVDPEMEPERWENGDFGLLFGIPFSFTEGTFDIEVYRCVMVGGEQDGDSGPDGDPEGDPGDDDSGPH